MIYPQHISLCTSTIENAGYVNRMSGVVRGRRLVTASYSIADFWRVFLGEAMHASIKGVWLFQTRLSPEM